MDFQSQLAGLNRLLTVIYAEETSLESLLTGLGFEGAQIALLRDRHLEALTAHSVELFHARLISESGKDLYFQILNRRYGLDGQAPGTLDSIAQGMGIEVAYARQLQEEALQRCQSKSALADFKKKLQHLAIAQLKETAESPTREHVSAKLVRLTDLRAASDLARMDFEAKRAEILKKIQPELDALNVEYEPILESVDKNLAALEAEIRTDVLLHGDSVQGGGYRAMYIRGRVSWDNEGMNDYASAHPDVLQYRKQGQPSVTLRAMGEK